MQNIIIKGQSGDSFPHAKFPLVHAPPNGGVFLLIKTGLPIERYNQTHFGGRNLMAKGVLYIMECNFPGMVMFGNVEAESYAQEMSRLRGTEFENIGDFRESYSILVEGHEQKANLILHLFAYKRIQNTNLLVIEAETLSQLLASFEGEQIFPNTPSEAELLRNAVATDRSKKENWGKVPTGMYYLSENRRLLGHIEARMHVKEGMFIVKAGSECFPVIGLTPKVRDRAVIEEGILQDDVVCHSPTAAATVVMGRKVNGWTTWKNINDMPINIYRMEN